ncbi:MAG: magnesium Mg(2+) and cobalt Co(2+) transport protein (corA) [Acidobacteria bacterium OLB17]|nr:MAG: magnesium Mg(2+) and cobalt Co(2+) transport protein (corA) [Acidobacteria bacterium OLB17]
MQIFVLRNGGECVEVNFTRKELPDLLADPKNVIWVDLHGETPEQVEEAKEVLENVFKFHYLTIEDCIETRNQPKVEAFPDYLYFIVHGIRPGETGATNFSTKELDGYLGSNFVVTYHAERFRSIKTVKQKVLSSPFTFSRGAAYVLHNILDELVDLYMPVVDSYDDTIHEMSERVLEMKRGQNEMLLEIMSLRRSVVRLRRISGRQLEALYRLSHGEFPQIPEQILPFYRDVHDHLVRITDLAENYRDLVSSLFEIHFSVISTRTNDVMKNARRRLRDHSAAQSRRRHLRDELRLYAGAQDALRLLCNAHRYGAPRDRVSAVLLEDRLDISERLRTASRRIPQNGKRRRLTSQPPTCQNRER